MEKISAVFDGLKFSETTLSYSLWLARKSDSILTGVFLDDFTYHGFKLFDMVGSQGISKEKVQELMETDKAKRKQAADRFKFACIENNVKHLVHHDKSIAAQELIRETIYSDLLLLSGRETFTHLQESVPSGFIRDVLSKIQCPVLILPDEFREFEKVILLYDGTPASVYAIKMFNYLMPWMKDLPAEVLTVQASPEVNEIPEEDLVREFIRCHYPNAKYTFLDGDPETVISDYLAKAGGECLAVLGAYQRSQVSRWFKPSMAEVLIRNSSQALFVAHKR